MKRSCGFGVLVLGFVLGGSSPSAQTGAAPVAPRLRATPPGIERLLPSTGPYAEVSEDIVVGVSSEWMVFSTTVWYPSEDWRYVLHHIPSGVNTGTGLLSTEIFRSAAFVPGGAVFYQGVYEPSEGADLNGDGDTYDVVLHAFDLGTWTTRNTGLAIGFEMSTPGTGTTVIFPVAETFDENGDGDVDDWIVYRGDLATDTIVSSAVETSSWRWWELWVEQDRAAWFIDEEPGKDYTGDGDFVDRVLYVHDFGLGQGLHLGLAVTQLDLAEGILALVVDEADQGADLDGDGVQDDSVLHLFDYATGLLVNLGEAGTDPVVAANRMMFRHADTGTPHVVDLTSGVVTDLGVPMFGVPVFVAEHFAFAGVEDTADWNGDGDTDDHVLWLHEPAGGSTFHLGVAKPPSPWSYWPPWFAPTEEGLLITQDEAGQGGTDLNGDGDALDQVWSLYSWDTGGVRSLRLAAIREPWHVGGGCGPFAALGVDEYDQGEDLDGDGYAAGRVWLTTCLGEVGGAWRVLDGALLSAPVHTPGLGWWVLTRQAMDGDGAVNDYAVAVLED